ncbi:hypothetical protein CY0110_19242 [Crocosphaera chwakensis CCY0110]|uniref:Uncharacterized protein n=1 Tax=Crocosphaera chwakensis CCY0110 TaxID=391612 RepID=A3IJI0_9CHRO|nr:hypothetical protein CY0110_19242 [Crocosphaera chwakensis CCY0110]
MFNRRINGCFYSLIGGYDGPHTYLNLP